MLEAILQRINNYFVKDIIEGVIEVADGAITANEKPIEMAENQYIRIRGSIFLDGVYKFPPELTGNEKFIGEVWLLAVPPAVIELADEITEWCVNNKPSALVSETFGGYSYTKGTNKSGTATADWSEVFADRLKAYKKI